MHILLGDYLEKCNYSPFYYPLKLTPSFAQYFYTEKFMEKFKEAFDVYFRNYHSDGSVMFIFFGACCKQTHHLFRTISKSRLIIINLKSEITEILSLAITGRIFGHFTGRVLGLGCGLGRFFRSGFLYYIQKLKDK